MYRWSICEYCNLNHSNQKVWAAVEFRMRGGSARGGSADRSGATHYTAWRDEFTDATQNLVLAVGARMGETLPFMIQVILVKRLSHDSGRDAPGIFMRDAG